MARKSGLLLGALSAAAFGFGTTLARLAYDGGADVFGIAVLRTVVFIALLGSTLALFGRTLRLPRRNLFATLWMAGTLAMVTLGYQGSVAFIPVSLAALVFYTFPFVVSLIAIGAGRDRLTVRLGASLLAAFVGLALSLGPGLASLDWRGVALALVATLGISLTLTFGGAATQGQDAPVMSIYTNIWVLLILAAGAAGAGGGSLPSTPLGMLSAAGICLSYLVAYVSWYSALSLVSPIRLAALSNIEPLVTLIGAWLVLGERLSPPQLIGAGLVLAAVVAITLDRSGARRTAAGTTRLGP